MTKRMLIDAAHPEETRVVIVDGTRVEELDFESRNKRQLRGNVYLAKVTRVEPSLQAAFIDYGGNRHGFLAFSEIHPDYYQIPYEDKLALQREEEELAAEEAEEEEEIDEEDEVEEDENLDPDEDDASDENDAEVASEQTKVASKRRKRQSRRRYKIQEVIKRGQILLVQAVKEERGNKGAAMTTYLSLAGRYCVLMPNTPRGGGISRKIPNGADRKRLKKIVGDLDVPSGIGVIVRTAGAKRTKAEITRDYSYLSRLWDEIRETTLKSIAPTLIHEEGNLVKRSIRDMYNKDIEEVLVQGEDAYKTAKGFIKMLMPSHAKFVKRYEEEIPLFLRFDVERQIENSLSSTVQLKSGGYLVIHPTEALVSVDVNSGRSTKERNVERTALKTNLEAAEELARQMRLRDLAGLIVVDFIDMDENKNNRAVERKMKEVLSRDRARIQTSRISQFGLMEISRQRRRRSLLEGSTAVCNHCDGVGRKRTVESGALAAIRAVEEFAVRGKAKKIRLKCPPDVALYLLNEKRELLTKVDDDHDVFTVVVHDDTLIRPEFIIEVEEKRSDKRKDPLIVIEKELKEEAKAAARRPKPKDKDPEDDDEEDGEATESRQSRDRDEDDEDRPKRRRRRGRRGGRNRKRSDEEATETADANEETDAEASEVSPEDDADEKPARKRRTRRRAPAKSKDVKEADEVEAESDTETDDDAPTDDAPKGRRRRAAPRRKSDSDDVEPKPKRRRAASKAKAEEEQKAEESMTDDAEETPKRRRRAPAKKIAEETAEEKPARKRTSRAKAPAKTATAKKAPAKDDSDIVEAEEKPKRARKAPARKAPARKAAAKKTPAKTADADDAAEKPKRTRRAAPKAKASEGEAVTPKPKRARKVPAKATTDSAEDAVEGKTPAKKAPAKKAPAKKAAPKKAASKTAVKKVEDEATAADETATPPRRRKAPSRAKAPASKAAPAKSSDSDSAASEQSAAETPAASDEKAGRRRKAPARKKGGLMDRLLGKSRD